MGDSKQMLANALRFLEIYAAANHPIHNHRTIMVQFEAILIVKECWSIIFQIYGDDRPIFKAGNKNVWYPLRQMQTGELTIWFSPRQKLRAFRGHRWRIGEHGCVTIADATSERMAKCNS